MVEPRYLIGIDLGTTTLKGGLFDLSGNVIAEASQGYPMLRAGDDIVEQNPQDWLDALDHVLVSLMTHCASNEVLASSICSQVQTHVFVDAGGQALAPAITWQDLRATAEAEALAARIDPALMAINASHTLPRIAWMQRHRPDLWASTAVVLSPKDFILSRLTGTAAADPLSCFDLVDGNGRYIDRLIALVPDAARVLPPLYRPTQMLGPGRHPRFGSRPVPFVAGTMDAWACLYGAGVKGPGEGAYISGTSEIVMLVGDRPGTAPGVVSFAPQHGWHVQAGPTQSGGDTLRWLSALFDRPYADVLAAAAAVPAGSGDMLFLPHLQGERAPLWDAHARGSLLGLTSASGMAEVVRAALEGVALSGRWLFEAASKAAGRSYPVLQLGGNGSQSALWSQIRADALGIRLDRLACRDCGAIGAAIIAGVGAGAFGSFTDAARRMVHVERRFTPNPELRAYYDRQFARYMAAYQALRPTYRS